MRADNPQVEQDIQRALANESATELRMYHGDPLTVNDARRIIDCLRENRENHRLDTLDIYNYSLHDDAVLNIFRDGLPLCTSVKTVKLQYANLSNEGLDRLRPAFYKTSITSLDLAGNIIQGQRGGEVIRDLLVGNDTLRELILGDNPIGSNGAIVLGKGLTGSNCLQKLILYHCILGNVGLANLLLSMDEANNNVLTNLSLCSNRIEGAEGGRQVSLLLQHFPTLKVLGLSCNNLGPLGACALAPGLAAATHLERLELIYCGLGNDGVASLVPDGQVNRTLTTLDLCQNNIQGLEGGESVIALASHCTNLDRLEFSGVGLSPDYRHRLNLLLEQKRLCTEAMVLAGSRFSVLFRFVEKAHRHEHGLSAIFVILQNDGEDYFYTAHNL